MYGQMNNGYYTPGYQPYYQQNSGAVPDVLSQYKGVYQQSPVPQPASPAPVLPPKATNDIIWVQGEAGAKGFLVAPNTTVVLWDTENPTIYVKTADTTGIPSMRVLDFTERAETSQNAQKRTETHECKCKDKFVPMETFNCLVKDMDVLRVQVDTISASLKQKSKKTEENTNG